jgi:ubiquinone/menaquinone biosynthesis C-methylase UbiE
LLRFFLTVKLAAEAANRGFVAGVDASSVMVAQARECNTAIIDAVRAEVKQALAADLPYEADFFDKVLTMNSLQIWLDPLAGLREIHRVLKPGGIVTSRLPKSMPEPKASIRLTFYRQSASGRFGQQKMKRPGVR